MLEYESDDCIPAKYRRIHLETEQLNTRYILDSILIPSMPSDAIVYTAICSKDLYPRDDWNFVFGQAYLKHRVGVSSVFDLEQSKPIVFIIKRI